MVAADAHVGHRRPDRVVGDPVDAVDDVGQVSLAPAVHHPYRHELDLLGHPVRAAADGARDVRAVAVAVTGDPIVVGEVVTVGRPAAELRVADPDAGVEHIRVHRTAVGHRVVRPGQRVRDLIDPVESPHRVQLDGPGTDEPVLLDRPDGRIGGQAAGVAGTQPHRERVVRTGRREMPADQSPRRRAQAVHPRVEHDDVAAGDRVWRARPGDHAFLRSDGVRGHCHERRRQETEGEGGRSAQPPGVDG
jgi:hypothetical protein